MQAELSRRTLLTVPPVLAAASLAACAEEDTGPTLALDAALPQEVPDGTRLIVGDPQTQVALELSGLIDELTFEVQFANISGGPKTQEAFRAGALDLGAVADIPPLQANWTGLPSKIVATSYRVDPLEHPVYDLGIAPGVDVTELADLEGKRIAFSPGQAQGALILRVLDKAGLTQDDVELVELPSNSDAYSNALAGGEIDVAPIGGTQVRSYLNKFASDGASTIPHGLRDDPWLLYSETETLQNADKAAAIAEYVSLWGVAKVWAWEHREEWIQGYYVEREGLPYEDGEYLFDRTGEPDVPADWTEGIARHEETIAIVAEGTDRPVLDTDELYDRRFETLAADGIASRAGAEAAQ
ncbi:ABC transporter substrate-binding protein [Glycomyces tenuis]|uniref:ABC transporter substrate-binding protein n=1 Tax=Glycomyces tenuis TaxID=58116 RepID=UPI0003FB8DD1|nr:ABC transporter substrate-binding protein [Glycomyces tenuis]